MRKLIIKIINKLYGGKSLIYYKKSKKHPLIGKRLFNIDYGFCNVTNVWNIKEYSRCTSGHNYEKDDKVIWHWKVKVKTDLGYYMLNLSDFVIKSTNADGSKIDDKLLYVFYK
jgi:hypothetical protein